MKMNKLLQAMGTAALVLLCVALIPFTIFLIAGILVLFGVEVTWACTIGAIIFLFILITIDVYIQNK